VAVSENQPSGTFIAHITVTDEDLADNGHVACDVTSRDHFQLVPHHHNEYLASMLYFALGRGAKYCDEYSSVCLSVRLHISETTRPTVTKFSVHVACSHGLVLLWRRCDMLCTSGFCEYFHTVFSMARRVHSISGDSVTR